MPKLNEKIALSDFAKIVQTGGWRNVVVSVVDSNLAKVLKAELERVRIAAEFAEEPGPVTELFVWIFNGRETLAWPALNGSFEYWQIEIKN